MTPVVRPATLADRPELLRTLRRAFAADPVVTWLTGSTRSTSWRRAAFFRLSVTRATVARGGCDLTDGGASVWYPPGAYGTAGHGSIAELPLAVAAFGTGIGRAARLDEEMRRLHPAEPHWYLSLIGAVPGRTGQGIGSALLAHRLAAIDEDHVSAYLESSSERNVPLYERFGFVITDQRSVVPGSPPVWLMLRSARGVGT